MTEREYQAKIIQKLYDLLPGCVIIRNDPDQIQGVPDLVILYFNQWAMLEIKLDAKSPEQPNQRFYVEKFDDMSFAAFLYPENEEEVLSELQRSFGVNREARISKSK